MASACPKDYVQVDKTLKAGLKLYTVTSLVPVMELVTPGGMT